MTISSGTRLGPYEIVDSIGAGGMGEVWRARDTRLDRDVAIKVLPQTFAASEEFLQRFDREARTISSLNHPHICTLHDVGHEDGTHYLVMELMEGESLAERLRKGPLPLFDVLKYGQQIASALDAAHRRGVIHRDLKPGNIMITRTGAKLLDFGLARTASEGQKPIEGLTSLPTEAKPLTKEGTILGTFQYMAPEQLEGIEADARTDIFAFGALLYEMATGRRAFLGESKTSLIAAIVSSHPEPISTLTPMAPPALDHVVRRCLEKDPEDRWQSAHDIATELQWISEAGSQAGVATPLSMRRKSRERLAWALLLLSVISIIGLVAGFLLQPTTFGEKGASGMALAVTFTVPAPADGYLRATGEDAAPAAISPDGERLVFGVVEQDGRNRLWVRELDEIEARPVQGTEGGSRPFWSPDGRSLGFFARGKLMRIDLAGGVALPVADAPANRGGTWSPDGNIIFAPDSGSPLLRVAATGGAVTPVTQLDREAGDDSHRYPSMLADGKTVVFLVLPVSGRTGTGSEAEQSIQAVRLDSGERKILMRGGANAQQVGDELLFYQGGALRSQTIDLDRLELIGSARTVIPKIKYDSAYEHASFSASDQTLVYQKGPYGGESILTWVDADGELIGTIGSGMLQTGPSISPDGREVATLRPGSESPGVWIVDDRGQERRVRATSSVAGQPQWSPDGSRLAYSAVQDGHLRTFIARLGEGRTDMILGESDLDWDVTDWSPDGKTLILGRNFSDSLVAYDIDAGGEPIELVKGPGLYAGQLSPDSRWLVYNIFRDGVAEIEITSFPGGSGRWVVSYGGGMEPRWSASGDAIYYRAPGGIISRTSIDSQGGNIRIGDTTRLFQAPPINDVSDYSYDVAPDGERFLINAMVDEDAHTPITIETGWNGRR